MSSDADEILSLRERIHGIADDVNAVKVTGAVTASEVKAIRALIEADRDMFVRLERFSPVEKLVYGFVALLLTGTLVYAGTVIVTAAKAIGP